MSHTIMIRTEFKNIELLKVVCSKMGLKTEMINKKAVLFSNDELTGLAIHLNKWNYPIVVGENGEIRYDSWLSKEGAMKELDILKRNYSLEYVRHELSMKCLPYQEKVLENGEIEIYVNN